MTGQFKLNLETRIMKEKKGLHLEDWSDDLVHF